MSTPTFRTEPAVIASFVEAVIVLAIAFGVDITTEQLAGVVTVVTLGLGLFVRSQVTPVG